MTELGVSLVAGLIFSAFCAVFSWGTIQFFNLRGRLFFLEIPDIEMLHVLKFGKDFIFARRLLYFTIPVAFLLGATFENTTARLFLCILLVIQFLSYITWLMKVTSDNYPFPLCPLSG